MSLQKSSEESRIPHRSQKCGLLDNSQQSLDLCAKSCFRFWDCTSRSRIETHLSSLRVSSVWLGPETICRTRSELGTARSSLGSACFSCSCAGFSAHGGCLGEKDSSGRPSGQAAKTQTPLSRFGQEGICGNAPYEGGVDSSSATP
jgi:hypothetical protein